MGSCYSDEHVPEDNIQADTVVSSLNYNFERNKNQIGHCYSDEHIPEDNIQADIATRSSGESQQKYRLRSVGNILLGVGDLIMFYQTLAL